MTTRIKELLGFKAKDDDDYSPAYPPGHMIPNSSMHRLQSRSKLPILELKVPMCCDKCQEKVREELEGLQGVRSVECDQFNQRVTITGNVDPILALKRVKKVKKKSEFFNQECHIDRAYNPMAQNNYNNSNNLGYGTQPREVGDMQYTQKPLIRSNSFGRGSSPYNNNSYNTHYVQQPGGGRPLGLMRSNSHDRNLNRLPSFGQVIRHDGARHLDFEPQDLQRDFYATRRMPSFKNHRHHDAEFIAMGNEHIPAISDTHYTTVVPAARNSGGGQRPAAGMLRSQVSFKKLPVSNPYYLRQISSDTH